jgi:hypothetical protein
MSYDLFGYRQFCNCRIDELGYCACGGTADWIFFPTFLSEVFFYFRSME